MNITELVDVASVIAAFAVVLTLPVLIVSIRQNTKAQRAIVMDNLAAGIGSINAPLTSNPAIGEAVMTATEDWRAASREQRIMAHYFLYSLFKLHESAFHQFQAGILEPHIWEGWSANVIKVYHSKGAQEVWWPARQRMFNKDFRAFLAASTPIEGSEVKDIFDPD
jgi:hypothetical protein